MASSCVSWIARTAKARSFGFSGPGFDCNKPVILLVLLVVGPAAGTLCSCCGRVCFSADLSLSFVVVLWSLFDCLTD